MIDLATLKKSVNSYWRTEFDSKPTAHPTGDTPFVTGVPSADACLYYLKTEYGLALNLSADFRDIVGYEVLDEKKFIVFALRWL